MPVRALGKIAPRDRFGFRIDFARDETPIGQEGFAIISVL